MDLLKNSNCTVNGKDNKIVIFENRMLKPYKKIKGLTITITGSNNEIIIEMPSKFVSTNIVVNGDNNKFLLKATKHRTIRHAVFGMENGGQITVGGGLSVYRDLNVVAKEGKKIEIGDECMFAREIMIRNNDGHTIIDRETKEIINAPEDIIIGNNVWLGARCMILKGTEIGDGSIVGAMSLVNKKFKEKNIIIAGNPARKVRENIQWDRADYHTYIERYGEEEL